MELSHKLFIWMQKCHQKRSPILPQMIRIIIRVLFSFEIHPTANIADGAEFVHNGLGCVFHEHVTIEDGVKIYLNVTLGGNGKPTQGPNCPTIKKGATIYAGACVLGPVTIGENAVVAANAVVRFNVPDQCLAAGVPAIIKKRMDDLSNKSEQEV